MLYHCDLTSELSKSGVALVAQREQSFTALAYGELIDVERITAPTLLGGATPTAWSIG